MGNQPWADVTMQIAVLCVLIATCQCQLTTKQSSNPTCNDKENLALASLLERLYSAEEKIHSLSSQLNQALDQLENKDEALLLERLERAEQRIQNQTSELAMTNTQLNQALDQLENLDEASLQERLESAEEKIQNQASELATIKSQLKNALDQLENIDEEKETIGKAVFVARGLGDSEYQTKVYNTNDRMIYRNANINPGSHYNTQTGEYTCPVNGTYCFTYTIQADDIEDGWGHSKATASLYREGTRISQIFFNNENTEGIDVTLTGSDIIECSEGDKVWVQSGWDNNHIWGYSYYSIFSGMLIHVT